MPIDRKQETSRTLTGYRWSRKPNRAVLLQDGLARYLIAVSGIGSIVAVSLVGLFLLWVVLPLFTGTSLEPEAPVLPVTDGQLTRVQGLDAYASMTWALQEGGTFVVRSLDDGSLLDRIETPYSTPPITMSLESHGTQGAFGFADGSLAVIALAFETEYLSDEDVPAEYHELQVGKRRAWNRGLLERTPEGQLRHQVLSVTFDDPTPLGTGPLLVLNLVVTPGGPVLAAIDSTGICHDVTIVERKNLFSGETTFKVHSRQVDLTALGVDLQTMPRHLLLDDGGRQLILAWPDGRASILRRESEGTFALSETTDLTPEPGVELTALGQVAGRVSLAVGDSRGRTTVWFPVPDAKGRNHVMTLVHDLESGSAAVTAFGASARSRLLAIGHADGSVRLRHVTSGRNIGAASSSAGAVQQIVISPREDLLVVAGVTGLGTWIIDAPHPEISFRIIAQPVWYEGYAEPTFVWQSSAASDTHEPKLSLVPLIYGTLKATFYSMLFGFPLALLAAIYTSEFLSRRVRARIKPGIETMASLPSVVLGFLAALVVAPFVENLVVEVLTVLISGPVFVLLGSHLWQLLPRQAATRLESWRPIGILVSVVLGFFVAWQVAPSIEIHAFGGDIKAWLSGYHGSGTPGWFFMLLVPCGALVGWLNVLHGEGLIRNRGAGWSNLSLASLDLSRFVVSAAATLLLAGSVAWLLNSTGWDPRGGVLDTYVQRNALVVGIAMGFAIIPIIYTISEDALSAVPDHLRAASLGAGATPWQTAIRVIVPPAGSGLFSAAMVGLGRAVGETMIVLMAAGNTPIMDMNIFNGFRTLAANLAVELPEAVQNSTHYRTLFLAALTLFGMTFVLNTVVEIIRQRYRRKTSQL